MNHEKISSEICNMSHTNARPSMPRWCFCSSSSSSSPSALPLLLPPGEKNLFCFAQTIAVFTRCTLLCFVCRTHNPDQDVRTGEVVLQLQLRIAPLDSLVFVFPKRSSVQKLSGSLVFRVAHLIACSALRSLSYIQYITIHVSTVLRIKKTQNTH